MKIVDSTRGPTIKQAHVGEIEVHAIVKAEELRLYQSSEGGRAILAGSGVSEARKSGIEADAENAKNELENLDSKAYERAASTEGDRIKINSALQLGTQGTPYGHDILGLAIFYERLRRGDENFGKNYAAFEYQHPSSNNTLILLTRSLSGRRLIGGGGVDRIDAEEEAIDNLKLGGVPGTNIIGARSEVDPLGFMLSFRFASP